MTESLLARPLAAASAVVYLAAVLLVGGWAWRRTRTLRDYYLAGQRIGLWVTSLATMSAAFSAFVFLGGPGLTYRLGVMSLFIIVPVGFTSGLLCWSVARPLRRLAAAGDVYTIPDAIARRYGSRPAAGAAAVAVTLGSLAYLGMQFLALGVLLQAAFQLDGRTGFLLGVLVVLAYSVAGGMIAGVYSDVLQGALMLAAAVAVFGRAVGAAGGWTRLTDSIAAAPAFGVEFLEPLGAGPAAAAGQTAFGFFFVFGIGVLGQPHLLHKFYMLDDPRKLRFLPLVLGGSQAVCVLVWLGPGLAVPALVAQGRLAAPAGPDLASPAFLQAFAPDALVGLVVAGILAAIMSTSDSLLNIGAAALTRDLPRAFGRAPLGGLALARLATVGLALAAVGFALSYADLIAVVGTFAFATFGAALAPALAVGLHWKRVSGTAATASIVTGITVHWGLEFLARQTWLPALPRPPLAEGALAGTVALAASFGVLFAVSGWRGGPAGPSR